MLTDKDKQFLLNLKAKGYSKEDAIAALNKVKGSSTTTQEPQQSGLGQFMETKTGLIGGGAGAKALGMAANAGAGGLKVLGNALGIAAEYAPSIVSGETGSNKVSEFFKDTAEQIGGPEAGKSAEALTGLDAEGMLAKGSQKVGEFGAKLGLALAAGAPFRALPAFQALTKGAGFAGAAARTGAEALVSVPETTAFVSGEGRLPTAGELTTGAAFSAGFQGLGEGLKFVGKKVIPTLFAKNVDSVIDDTVESTFKPTGKTKFSDLGKFNEDFKQSMKTITANKDALNLVDDAGEKIPLPTNMAQLSDAIEQTKKLVFDQYDSLKQAAGETGVTVDLVAVAKELESIGQNKVIKDLSPEVYDYAEEMMNKFFKTEKYTADEAQQALTLLNKKLQAFYKSPTPEGFGKAYVDQMIANNIRTQLDEAISSATGSDYQILKNQYGNLKSIETTIFKKMLSINKGMSKFDKFFNAMTGSDVITGLATMNPAQVAKGATQGALKAIFEWMTSPDAKIKTMFDALDGAVETAPTEKVTQGSSEMVTQIYDYLTKNNPELKGIDPTKASQIIKEVLTGLGIEGAQEMGVGQ